MRKIVEIDNFFPVSVKTEYRLDKQFKNTIRIIGIPEYGFKYQFTTKLSWRRFKKSCK